MKILFDTHTHTLASTHAYSTVMENAKYASEIGMEAIAVTDHAPAIPDGAHEWHFLNLKALPREKRALFILRYWYAESIPSIAGQLAMSENNVSVSLNRLRKKLKEHLPERGYEL